MSYRYEDLKSDLFTEAGSVAFTRIRDRVRKVVREAGAITMGSAIHGASGDSWVMLACVDRLVELGELREVGTTTTTGPMQERCFVPGREWVAP